MLLINVVGYTAGESDTARMAGSEGGACRRWYRVRMVHVLAFEVDGLCHMVRHDSADLAELLLIGRFAHFNVDAVGLGQRLVLWKR